MKYLNNILLLVLLVYLTQGFASETGCAGSSCRTFKIDYANNQLLLNNASFRYISGSIHYFRVHYLHWRDRLRKLRYAGFNTVQTYIEWSSHEPEPGQYKFKEGLDVVKFIELAQTEGLHVILRVGPYICAERDMGGLPYWILKKYPNIQLRSSDPNFLGLVEIWFSKVLLPKIKPLLYENGGPVIALHVENEYGNSGVCDIKYTSALRDIIQRSLGSSVVLMTTDNARPDALRCGKIPGVYATVDFGPDVDPVEAFAIQRLFEPHGPFINSEYYSGWLDHWGEPRQKKDPQSIVTTMKKMLNMNASVNMYMFHGGTNFGFSSGANIEPFYKSNPTTYDYDAPLTEAGDVTEKYNKIRELIIQYVPAPPGPVPPPSKKYAYGKIQLNASLTVEQISDYCNTTSSKWPLSFEDIGLFNGIMMYQTTIPFMLRDPSILKLEDIHDRGYIYVNNDFMGTVTRELDFYRLPIYGKQGDKLTIIVESLGRTTVGPFLKDFKGIRTNVTLNNHILKSWKISPVSSFFIPPDAKDKIRMKPSINMFTKNPYGGMTLYVGSLFLENEPNDTFLRLKGWTKGMVYINGENLGRYWPVMGPQMTLYVPKGYLYVAMNLIYVLELEKSPCNDPSACYIEFVDKPDIDGPVPV